MRFTETGHTQEHGENPLLQCEATGWLFSTQTDHILMFGPWLARPGRELKTAVGHCWTSRQWPYDQADRLYQATRRGRPTFAEPG